MVCSNAKHPWFAAANQGCSALLGNMPGGYEKQLNVAQCKLSQYEQDFHMIEANVENRNVELPLRLL